MPPETAAEVDFEKGDGLVPCIAQDARTGRVLMLAYMNQTALERTLETGQVHYWSRSRQELWRKGATSGHTQELVALSQDCDGDTLLALVHQTGPACHTGKPSCFFTGLAAGAAASRLRDAGQAGEGGEASGLPILPEVWQVIEQRAEDLPEGSWTTRLLTEEGLVEGKVLEEAREVVDRAGGQGEDPLAHEIADLLYHVLVLGAKHGVTLEDVMAELEARRG